MGRGGLSPQGEELVLLLVERSLLCGEHSGLWLSYERTWSLFSVWRGAVCPSPWGEVTVNDSLISGVVPSEETIQDIIKSVEELLARGHSASRNLYRNH